MAKRVFVTGGSGFVGTSVIEGLLSRGYEVNALSHKAKLDSRVNLIRGDLFDPAALDAGIRGCDVVIHLVGIILEKPAAGVTFQRMHVEGTKAVVDATKRAGVRRYIHMSALGVRPNADSMYHRTKHEAEEYVRADGLDWTILRPSMIHGPRGEFTQMQAAWAKKKSMPFLFMPYFGGGVLGFGESGKLQPVFVDDVARSFVDAIERPATIGQAYSVAGPDVYTWPQFHRAVARAVVGHDRWVMPIPAWYAKALTYLAPASLLPFNYDQVIMSREDNIGDLTNFEADFGWMPRGLAETLDVYAQQLR